jgi:methylmalonyl-CoA/ethylmalonyl-CoA epimerase
MRKIEHIGIAVADLEKSNELFKNLIGKEHFKTETVEGEGVETSFFQVGETKVELLQATRPDSPISKYLEKKSEGVHHIAFDVEDIHAEVIRLKNAGFEILNETPKSGADNKLVVFLHPRSTNGVLVELCQENPNS